MKFLAFIDLLGFSNMVKKNYSKAKNILNDFYSISYQIINQEPRIQGSLISDSLVMYSIHEDILIETTSKIYRKCLKKNNEYPEKEINTFFLLPRGGISKGSVHVENRYESANLQKDFIVSPALVHSADMEQEIKGSRIFYAVQNDNSNNNPNILYDSEIKLWDQFRYKDVLWFRDLSKSNEEQKKEIKNLINIAIKLIKNNANQKDSILEQHMQTLRIGLLSYSKLFETNSDSGILDSLLSNFRDDKYWLIWIAIIEMIIESKNKWTPAARKKIVDFYKNICLSQGWINVLEYINLKNQKYLKNLFKQFINELSFKNTAN